MFVTPLKPVFGSSVGQCLWLGGHIHGARSFLPSHSCKGGSLVIEPMRKSLGYVEAKTAKRLKRDNTLFKDLYQNTRKLWQSLPCSAVVLNLDHREYRMTLKPSTVYFSSISIKLTTSVLPRFVRRTIGGCNFGYSEITPDPFMKGGR